MCGISRSGGVVGHCSLLKHVLEVFTVEMLYLKLGRGSCFLISCGWMEGSFMMTRASDSVSVCWILRTVTCLGLSGLNGSFEDRCVVFQYSFVQYICSM